LQCAVIEYARNVANLPTANSTEFDDHTEHPVIAMLRDQRHIERKGGTMRLGTYPCAIPRDTLAHRLYGTELVLERHRHRYEVNPRYHQALSEAGMTLSGTSPDGRLAEMIELSDHPYFIASQFHPEFKSRPTRAHPLFRGLIAAALKERARRTGDEAGPEKNGSDGELTLDDIRRSIAK